MQLLSLSGLNLFFASFNSSYLPLRFCGVTMLELPIWHPTQFSMHRRSTSKLITILFVSKSIHRSFVLATCQQRIKLQTFSRNHYRKIIFFSYSPSSPFVPRSACRRMLRQFVNQVNRFKIRTGSQAVNITQLTQSLRNGHQRGPIAVNITLTGGRMKKRLKSVAISEESFRYNGDFLNEKYRKAPQL